MDMLRTPAIPVAPGTTEAAIAHIRSASQRLRLVHLQIAEAPQPLAKCNYQALRCLCGVAPVTRRSGKSKIVVRRLATHPRLRDALYHWARVAVQHDPASKAKYAALRARGHGHTRALRSVADRLLAVACAMLRWWGVPPFPVGGVDRN